MELRAVSHDSEISVSQFGEIVNITCSRKIKHLQFSGFRRHPQNLHAIKIKLGGTYNRSYENDCQNIAKNSHPKASVKSSMENSVSYEYKNPY